MFGFLTGSSESTYGSFVVSNINVFYKLSLKLLDEVVHHSVVKVLSCKMGVTGCSMHVILYTVFNGQLYNWKN